MILVDNKFSVLRKATETNAPMIFYNDYTFHILKVFCDSDILKIKYVAFINKDKYTVSNCTGVTYKEVVLAAMRKCDEMEDSKAPSS